MKIVDKSGGFWLNVIKHKMNPNMAFQQNYMPDKVASRYIAEEIISGMKGSVKHKFSVRHVRGRLVIARFGGEKYKTGIMQRRSPDGTPYAPLSEMTLALRKAEGNTRGKAFILRETGKHIMGGLKIISQQYGRLRTTFEIGWTGDDAVRAKEHNEGFVIVHGRGFGGGPRDFNVTPVPARRHIGVSIELRKNLQLLWNKIAK